MTARHITLEAARRLAISAQGLDATTPPPQPGPEALYRVIEPIGCLQLDPISAVARSHTLVVWSRAGVYDPGDLDRLLFHERRLFEYWAHEASIVLTDDYPIHAVRMRTYATGESPWQAGVRAWVQANKPLHDHILSQLSERGPLLSRQIEETGIEPTQWVTSGWSNGRNVSRMLDYLWMRGEIMVSARVGGQKQWDLAARVLPPTVPRHTLSPEQATRQAVVKAVRALGVATATQITKHYTRRRYHDLPAALEALTAEGQLLPIKVEGLAGSWFMAAADEPRLRAIEAGQWAGRTTLLSPFDNLICDRDRTRLLFDFDFTIEIYTPVEKRRFGYYAMPILHGDRLIGRIDPRYDRKARVLEVAHIYAEPGADARAPKTTARAIHQAIGSLGAFLGAADVRIGQAPDRWN